MTAVLLPASSPCQGLALINPGVTRPQRWRTRPSGLHAMDAVPPYLFRTCFPPLFFRTCFPPLSSALASPLSLSHLLAPSIFLTCFSPPSFRVRALLGQPCPPPPTPQWQWGQPLLRRLPNGREATFPQPDEVGSEARQGNSCAGDCHPVQQGQDAGGVPAHASLTTRGGGTRLHSLPTEKKTHKR